MFTKAAYPSSAIISCWCPLLGRKGHPKTILADHAAQILTFLSQHAPPSTMLKLLVAWAPSPQSATFFLTPRSRPAGFCAKVGGVEVEIGKLGFSVQESVIVVLGQVHLLLSPEVREWAPEIQPP